MCVGCMHFRAPHSALKPEKNYQNSLNILSNIIYFQGPFKFIKRHLLATFQNNGTFFDFVMGVFQFSCCFVFNKLKATYVFRVHVKHDGTRTPLK